MDYRKLQTEIETDPTGAGYATMTDKQIADEIDAVNKTQNRTSMSRSEVYEKIDATALAALTSVQLAQLNLALSDTIDPFGNAAQVFVDVFGAGSTTITALAAARTEVVSRGSQIGIGPVESAQAVALAKAGGA